ncbi:MAG TPA: lipid II flippase MurJ [Micromonosporaceae bacterium]
MAGGGSDAAATPLLSDADVVTGDLVSDSPPGDRVAVPAHMTVNPSEPPAAIDATLDNAVDASAVTPGMRRLAGAAALIAILTIASRLIGFIRTLVLGKVAIGSLSTAYLTANAIPNIIFEIVAGGALASLVVPLVAGDVARRRPRAVGATASALITWVLVILVPLAVLVAVFARPIVSVLLGAVSVERATTIDVGTRMLEIFAPQIPLYGIGIVLSGLLQAHRRFAWPVLAPLLSSAVVIATYVVYGVTEPADGTLADVSVRGQSILAIGTTLGVVALSLSLVIPVRRLALPWRPTLRFDDVARRSVRGLAAVGVVTVVAQQLTLALATRLANSGTPPGTIYVLTLTQTIYLVPWSVLALPVATSVFPALASAYATGDPDSYRRTSAGATRTVALLSTLGGALLIAAAEPIARLFAATASSTRPDPSALEAAIIAFAPGLIGYGLYALHSRALFARGENRFAAIATLIGWGAVAAASVGLSFAFGAADRVTALGAANSAGMIVLAAVLIAMIARRAGAGAVHGVARALVTAVGAGALAAAAGIAVRQPMSSAPGVGGDITQGLLSGFVALVVFAAVAIVADRDDARPMIARLARAARRDRAGKSGAATNTATNTATAEAATTADAADAATNTATADAATNSADGADAATNADAADPPTAPGAGETGDSHRHSEQAFGGGADNGGPSDEDPDIRRGGT